MSGEQQPLLRGTPVPNNNQNHPSNNDAEANISRDRGRKSIFKSFKKAGHAVSSWFGVSEDSFQDLMADDADDGYENKVWYHGQISFVQSEQRLRKQRRRMLVSRIDGNPDGLFLVRATDSGRLYLVVFANAEAHEFEIFRMGTAYSLDYNAAFPSIDQMILWYNEAIKSPLPCRLNFVCRCPSRNVPTAGLSEYAFATDRPNSSAISYQTQPSTDKNVPSHVDDDDDEEEEEEEESSSDLYANLDNVSDPSDIPLKTETNVEPNAVTVASSSSTSETQLPSSSSPNNTPKVRSAKGDEEDWQDALRYCKPDESNKMDVKAQKKKKVDRLMKRLPTFTPYFMNVVMLVQFIMMCIMLAETGINNIAFKPSVLTQEVQMGFNLEMESLTITKPANVFIGPSNKYLIEHGAQYTPCMRKDIAIFATYAKQREEETTMGCCVAGSGSSASCGYTTQTDCNTASGNFSRGIECPVDCATFRLRPCCSQQNGTCVISTRDYCGFVSGIYVEDAETCGEVSCLAKTCGFTMPNTESPNQWYRFFMSIFIHAGIIHYLICLFLQSYVCVPIERSCGWLRMALIYLISAFGGNVFSGIFSLDFADVGPTGAICGCLATELIRIWNFWPGLKKPVRKLLITIAEIVVLLLLGTLPWVDNFAHIGGLFFGLLAAIVFLPYVTFGKWDRFRKRF